MNLEYLQNFLGLVKFMNYTRAADHLHMSQSALSKQISLLESSLNTPLIIRDSRSIKLTAAGVYLADQGPRLMKIIEDIERNLSYVNNQGAGSLTISMINDGSSHIYQAMNSFQSDLPGTALIIKRDVLKDVVYAVVEGVADIGLTTDYAFTSAMQDAGLPLNTLQQLTLEQKSFFLVVPSDSPFAGRESISLAEIPTNTPIAIGSNIKSHIDRLSPEAGQKLSRFHQIPTPGTDFLSWEHMIVQVRMHKYIVINTCPNLSDGCARLRIEDDFYRYKLILLWRADNPNALMPHFLSKITDPDVLPPSLP